MPNPPTLRFNLALALDRFAFLAPWCLYGFGVTLLGMKLLRPTFLTLPVLAGGWAVVLAVLLAADLLAQKGRWYSPEFVNAWLDCKNRAGGRIIAGAEPSVPLRVLPAFTLRHLGGKMLWPVVFIIAAWLAPAADPTRNVSGAGLEQAIARLEDRVDEAAADQILPTPEAEEMRRQLEALREMAENRPEAAAEALSALGRKIEAAMAERLEKGADALEKTLEAAEALRDGNAADPARADAEKALAEMFSAWNEMAQNAGGADKLPPEMRDALDQAMRESGAASLGQMAEKAGKNAGAVSRESVEKMLKALADNAGQTASAAGGKAGKPQFGTGDGEKGDGQTGGEGSRGEGAGRVQSLADSLAELASRVEEGELYGTGGISKGGGPTPLVFGGETGEAGARFDYQALPEGAGVAPGMKIRDERTAPDETPEEFRPQQRTGASVADRVRAGDAGAGLGPARAKAAERYFQAIMNSN